MIFGIRANRSFEFPQLFSNNSLVLLRPLHPYPPSTSVVSDTCPRLLRSDSVRVRHDTRRIVERKFGRQPLSLLRPTTRERISAFPSPSARVKIFWSASFQRVWLAPTWQPVRIHK